MRIAGTLPYSVVNGTGVRFVVFVQGCAHHCPGCHNPDTWDFAGGEIVVESARRVHYQLPEGRVFEDTGENEVDYFEIYANDHDEEDDEE